MITDKEQTLGGAFIVNGYDGAFGFFVSVLFSGDKWSFCPFVTQYRSEKNRVSVCGPACGCIAFADTYPAGGAPVSGA